MPSSRAGNPATSLRTRTLTAGRPSASRPTAVPTTPGTLMSSPVCRSWMSMATDRSTTWLPVVTAIGRSSGEVSSPGASEHPTHTTRLSSIGSSVRRRDHSSHVSAPRHCGSVIETSASLNLCGGPARAQPLLRLHGRIRAVCSFRRTSFAKCEAAPYRVPGGHPRPGCPHGVPRNAPRSLEHQPVPLPQSRGRFRQSASRRSRSRTQSSPSSKASWRTSAIPTSVSQPPVTLS